jgi:hypothetical protein
LRQAIWSLGAEPRQLASGKLASESTLEDMIVAAPAILGEPWLLIGRQEITRFNGRVDLLALAPDASLVLIEIKRDRTPRDVVAQALDYASWVETLDADAIAAIYRRFRPDADLATDFRTRFGIPLEEDLLNQTHRIVIVAGQLDDDSERIVRYLAERGIAIDVLCFQVFQCGEETLLARAWLGAASDSEPVPPQQAAVAASEPWNGQFYASFGDGASRSWDEARRWGFISAGGAAWYSKTLHLLRPGDRVWVKSPDHGFLGVGHVTTTATPARAFRVREPNGREVPILEVLSGGQYHREFVDDDERCEWFVGIQWEKAIDRAEGIREIGLFGNQNTVCRPTTPKWRATVERLRQRFGVS